jgi:hypothetical protein
LNHRVRLQVDLTRCHSRQDGCPGGDPSFRSRLQKFGKTVAGKSLRKCYLLRFHSISVGYKFFGDSPTKTAFGPLHRERTHALRLCACVSGICWQDPPSLVRWAWPPSVLALAWHTRTHEPRRHCRGNPDHRRRRGGLGRHCFELLGPGSPVVELLGPGSLPPQP